MSTDETLNALLSDEVSAWLCERLTDLRAKRGHGMIELHVQDGYVITYHEKKSYKVSGRSRIRTHKK